MGDVEAKRAADVLRQIEYYLSDVALPYDDFLKKAYDENGGSIPLSIIAESPRIVKMLADKEAVDARVAYIAEVLTKEADSSVKILDGTKVARVYPLPADDPKAPHSVYMGGCAKNLSEEALTAALTACVAASTYAPIVSIRRLRDLQRDRSYSGQLFIELESAEKAESLARAAMRGACGVPCNKAKVLSDYFSRQHETMLEQREKLAAKRAAAAAAGGSSGSGEKRPRVEMPDQAAGKPLGETAEEQAEREKKEAEQAEADRLLILRFEGAGADADREGVEACVSPHAKFSYIEFSRGETNGHVRFESAELCKAALDALGVGGSAAGAVLGSDGAVPTWRLLTSDESKEYWQLYRERKKDRNKRQRSGGYGGKGGGGKGKGKGGGGKGKGGGRR